MLSARIGKIPGIGPKTSRFFITWTRPDANYATLDVHILRWMKEQGYSIPIKSPSKKQYAQIEKLFLKEAEKRGKTARELDVEIWDKRRLK